MNAELKIVGEPHAEVIPLEPRIIVKRPTPEGHQKGRGHRLPRLLSPRTYPGADTGERFYERLLSHRIVLDLPPGSPEALRDARSQGTAYVYRRGKDGEAELVPDVFGSNEHLNPSLSYAYPTTDAVKHPVRSIRELLLRRKKDPFVLVNFGAPTPEPPPSIRLSM